jgi:hypothetical protein
MVMFTLLVSLLEQPWQKVVDLKSYRVGGRPCISFLSHAPVLWLQLHRLFCSFRRRQWGGAAYIRLLAPFVV